MTREEWAEVLLRSGKDDAKLALRVMRDEEWFDHDLPEFDARPVRARFCGRRQSVFVSEKWVENHSPSQMGHVLPAVVPHAVWERLGGRSSGICKCYESQRDAWADLMRAMAR